MPERINRIRNADFTRGHSTPTGWEWGAGGDRARWRRGIADWLHGDEVGSAARPSDRRARRVEPGIVLYSDDPGGRAAFSQVVRCKPCTYYRIEAVVACRVDGQHGSGVTLSVEPLLGRKRAGDGRVTPPIHRASLPVTIRAWYRTGDEVRRLRVSVRLNGGEGSVWIREARVIQLIEPDEVAHPLALPPPSHAAPPPWQANAVCVCSRAAESRGLTGLLRGRFGDRNVRVTGPADLDPGDVGAGAVLLPDATPPHSVRSLAALFRLGDQRTVVISLPAFARLARQSLKLRRIEQPDDPMYAKVVYSNYVTNGFALHDVFPYAWPGRAPGSFVQNQFRKTPQFESFCKRHGLTVLLVSMCDKDATSDQPICLFRETPGGGVFVLDMDPVEAAGSTLCEPALAMQMLLAVLGHGPSGAGQYITPPNEVDFRRSLLDMADRFPEFVVHGPDVPDEEAHDQLVTVGREDHTYGLPLKPKPMILVRSGVQSGDVESVYGAFMWIKQLIRNPPHTCPYAQVLVSQFRFAWVPSAAEWEQRNGWARRARPPSRPMTLELDNTGVATLIDLVSVPVNRVRVVLPALGPANDRYRSWLPRLMSAFGPTGFFAPSVPDGATFSDRDRIAWRLLSHTVEVVADPTAFTEPIHSDVFRNGGEVVRLEVPGGDADFTALSIHRTGVTVAALEHVIGLQYGLVAVNRGYAPVHFDGFPTLKSGEALIVHRDDAMLRAADTQAG